MKILMVEDDKWWGENASLILKKAGHQVLVVPHAVGAIEAIDDFRPDMILLDMMLTGETGLGLLHELQSHQDLAMVPVVVMSSLELALEELRPYGVIRILDKTTMEPSDLEAATKL